jgi:hypothetical protein
MHEVQEYLELHYTHSNSGDWLKAIMGKKKKKEETRLATQFGPPFSSVVLFHY